MLFKSMLIHGHNANFLFFLSSIISFPKGIRSSLSSSDEVFLYLMRYVHYWIMYIVYHAPRGTKLSGTQNNNNILFKVQYPMYIEVRVQWTKTKMHSMKI